MKRFIIFPEGELNEKAIEEYDDRDDAIKHAEEATQKTERPYIVMEQIATARIVKTVEVTTSK